MTIHRNMLNDVPTRPGRVAGILWQQAPQRKVCYEFNADFPIRDIPIHPPYVDIEGSFSALPMPTPPEVYDTLIKTSSNTILVTSYYDARLEPNPNLRRKFPLIPWRGEVALLFLGKRRHFLARGPADSVISHVLATYLGVCLADAQLGIAFPAYMEVSDRQGVGLIEYEQ